MARVAKLSSFFLLLLFLAPLGRAQFIAIGGGVTFPQDRSAALAAGRIGGPAQADFANSGIIAVDAGVGFFPFLTAGLHYSFSRPELFLRRGDAFGSSARVDLDAHTITFDARFRTPQVVGFRLYGLAGGGITRFALNMKQAVEVPFGRGAPDNVLSPVLTVGGGIERSVAPFVHLKLEVRDYITPISEQFFQPGGAWHRVAVIGGIVLGR